MADKITETNTLAVEIEYSHTDSETQETANKKATLKLPNYKSNLTEQAIKTAVSQAIYNPGVLMDAYGAPFETQTSVIATAYTEYEKKTEYDIGVD